MLNVVEALVKYLNAPIIVDDFVDHSERRAWRKELSGEDLSFVESNRLRQNAVNAVLGRLEAFSYLADRTPIVLELEAFINDELQKLPYDPRESGQERSLEEQIEYAHMLAGRVKDILNHFVELGFIVGKQL